MNKKKIIFLAFLCLVIVALYGCTAENNNSTNDSMDSSYENKQETNNIQSADNSKEQEAEKEIEGASGSEQAIEEENAQTNDNDDTELEKSLADYREERETMTSVKMGNGLQGYGAPNPEDYGISEDEPDYMSRFDSRELNEAYEAAKTYVKEILALEVETKSTVYPCIDPRIIEIYADEDKGVATGYESNNIFVCEYCDSGKWQYLILVREAKGEPWNVIHHGSSFKE